MTCCHIVLGKKPTNKERKLKQERCMRMPVSHQTCIVWGHPSSDLILTIIRRYTHTCSSLPPLGLVHMSWITLILLVTWFDLCEESTAALQNSQVVFISKLTADHMVLLDNTTLYDAPEIPMDTCRSDVVISMYALNLLVEHFPLNDSTVTWCISLFCWLVIWPTQHLLILSFPGCKMILHFGVPTMLALYCWM